MKNINAYHESIEEEFNGSLQTAKIFYQQLSKRFLHQ